MDDAVQADTRAALAELCALVQDQLDDPAQLPDVPAPQSGDVRAGLRAFCTAVVGAADIIRERIDDIVATLPGPSPDSDPGAVDTSVLTARGAAALDRVRNPPAVRRGAGAPPEVTELRPIAKLPRLAPVQSVDDVVARFDEIIDWAIEYPNGIGYFATVYRRATVAIRDKIRSGDYFDDNVRMARFDIIFAQRYFDALNTYFHPGDYEAPTHAWQWCFVGHSYDEPIILQHMLTAVNSHVNLDLGIAAMTVADGELASLQADFNRINTLLADEVAVFLDTLGTLSPRVRLIRRVLPCEDPALNALLRIFRNLAWSFANQLDTHAERRRDHIGIHDSWAAVLGSYYLHTNDTINRFVEWIAGAESRDVAHNMRVLAGRPSQPGN